MDYNKKSAKRSALRIGSAKIEGSEGSLLRMIKEVEAILGDVLNAYVPCYTDLAEAVHLRTHRVDQRYNGLFHVVLTHTKEVPRNISTSVRLHSIAKKMWGIWAIM